jgi:small conductance mechanosensitive channel
MDLAAILDKIYGMLAVYGIKIIAAAAILIIGISVAKLLRKIMQNILKKRDMDPTLGSFVGSLIYYALIVFVVLAALAQLGIQTTSFIAVIGAAGLAIGLALQGSLANFAAGFLIILFCPFKVGDYIEGAGTAGTVEEINILSTQLKTPDNKTVIVPNSNMTSGNIVNYSTKGTRRVDMVFGISYEDDIDKAKKILQDIINEDERVLKEPEPLIALAELGDSSVNFYVRPWTKADDYWSFLFDTTEKVKKRFDNEGISIPYPQQDIHLYQHKTEAVTG